MGLFDGIGEALGITVPGLGIGGKGEKAAYNESSNPEKVQKIESDRWNKLYPYSFQIIEWDGKGTPSNGPFPKYGLDTDEVILTIPPSSLNITTQFASAVSATNNGILEENNGVIFRTIQIQGTTGVWSKKPNAGVRSKEGPATAILKNIMPGAFSAVAGAASAVKKAVAGVVGPDTKPILIKDKSETGYYQFWNLHNFLVTYAEAKKKKGGGDLYLIFNNAKDNLSLMVTPQNFELKRDASNPLLYKYSITMKAWRISPATSTLKPIDFFDGVPRPENVNAIKSITNSIKDARGIIFESRKILSGIHSDFVNIFNVANQCLLVGKEFGGLEKDYLDFGTILSNNVSRLTSGENNEFYSDVRSTQAVNGKTHNAVTFTSTSEDQSLHPSADTQARIASAGGNIASIGANARVTAGGEDKVVSNFRKNQVESEVISAFQDPDFVNKPIDLSILPPSVQDQVESYTDDAFKTTSGQVRDLTGKIQEVSNNFEANIGMMDETYAAIFGIPVIASAPKTATEDDILRSVSLQESRSGFLSMLATGQIFRERDGDPFISANSALESGDQLNSPSSGTPVLFQRGGSLERLAQQYLGDPNRAREIAILNDLRSPYIDETGFDVLIENAYGRTFVVNIRDNLTINQSVKISGTGVAPTSRRILDIEEIGGGQFRVMVDGPDNLGIYAPVTAPKITTRLPGTVGPGDVILIPNASLPEGDFPVRPSPLYNRLSHAEKVFKIDLALDDQGRDLAVSANGDVNRSFGYANAVQIIRLALEIERGELEQHISYGLSTPIGSRNSDLSIEGLRSLIQRQIQSDSRFVSANVGVQIEGSVVRIDVNAQGASGTGLIPVTFEIGSP